MRNDELLQQIIKNPGLSSKELTPIMGIRRHCVQRRLNELEKYKVLRVENEIRTGEKGDYSTRIYYPTEEALKYKRREGGEGEFEHLEREEEEV